MAEANASISGANSSRTLNVRRRDRLPIFPVSLRSSSKGKEGTNETQPFVPCTKINEDKTAPYDVLPCTTNPLGNCKRNEMPCSTSENLTVSCTQDFAATST